MFSIWRVTEKSSTEKIEFVHRCLKREKETDVLISFQSKVLRDLYFYKSIYILYKQNSIQF